MSLFLGVRKSRVSFQMDFMGRGMQVKYGEETIFSVQLQFLIQYIIVDMLSVPYRFIIVSRPGSFAQTINDLRMLTKTS